MVDLREQILKADDLKTEKVHVKEWGCDVHIRQCSGKEKDEYEKDSVDSNVKNNLTNLRARLVARCLVDKDGKQVFSKEDIPALSEKSGPVLEMLIDKIAILNRVSQEDLEVLAKN